MQAIKILNNDYIVNRNLGNVLVVVLLVLLIISILLIIKYCNKSKTEKIIRIAKNDLESDYQVLLQEYNETTTTNEQLNTKCEELKLSKEKLSKLAYNDNLTGLPSRIAFIEMLDGVMLTLRNEEVIAVMNVDLDNFKKINDTLGHSYGDELLIDVTHRLKQAIDENDYLARGGGDEFMILSQNITDMSEYENKVKMIQKIFSYPFVLAMKEYFITVSIGITFAPKDGKTTQVLMKNADSAKHTVKKSGKNTYIYFDESINDKLMDKIQIQSELRKAIENDEFVIYYQPQINLNTNKIVGFEALLRWEHPTRGILVPNEFIPLANETGLIVPIGKWVLAESCKLLNEWEDNGFTDLTMAVNISRRQFNDHEFINMVKTIVEETAIQPNKLVLEITEAVAIDDMSYCTSTIEKLKEVGVLFSIDDFGTGYSSLNYLKDIPINSIKIDQNYLTAMNLYEQKIVEYIISLAKILNLEVIAEGVEEIEQEQFLKKVKCNIVQGFLYSEPVPKEIARELLNKTDKK